jgi:hypothetical protein
MRLPEVIGTAEGAEAGRPVLLILVRRLPAAPNPAWPESIEGYPVRLREVGEVRAKPRP